jgi:uncharacterized membrane protein YuzA (DUF378 family)
MKNKTIGYLCILASIGLFIMSPFVKPLWGISPWNPICYGIAGLITGILIIWLGKIFKMDEMDKKKEVKHELVGK